MQSKIQPFIRYAFFLAILVLGIVIYANSLDCPFHFDGKEYIVKNMAIRDISNVKGIWNAMSYPSRFVGFYSFALNYHFHELDVFGYHLVNVIIHLVNAFLVWWFVYQTLLLSECRISHRDKNDLMAGVCALLFLVHPIQTQAVTYITQRFASLATLFYLLSICLYIKGRRSIKHGSYFFMGAILSAIFGMFTKQIVLTLPVMIFTYEFFFFRNKAPKDRGPVYPRYLYLVFLILLLIIPAIYAFNVKGILLNKLPSRSYIGETITAGTYFLTQFRVIVKYIGLYLMPYNQNLLYDFRLSLSLFEPHTLLSFFVLAGLVITALVAYKKHRLISFGIAWFFIALSVESSIIPIRTVIFEHRMYLPSVGLCLVTTVLMVSLIRKKSVLIAFFGVVIVAHSYLTIQRNHVWQDEIALWYDVVRKSPESPTPRLNLGVALADQGQYHQAKEYFQEVIRLSPANIMAYNNLGNIYNKLGDKPQAIKLYQKVIALNPKQPGVFNNLGSAYYDLKDYQQAKVNYMKALKTDTDDPNIYYNLGNVYSKSGELTHAIEMTRRAIQINPRFTDAHYNLGLFHYQAGHKERAVNAYKKALSINPTYGAAHNNLAVIYFEQGMYPSAINHIDQAGESGYKANRKFLELLNQYRK